MNTDPYPTDCRVVNVDGDGTNDLELFMAVVDANGVPSGDLTYMPISVGTQGGIQDDLVQDFISAFIPHGEELNAIRVGDTTIILDPKRRSSIS